VKEWHHDVLLAGLLLVGALRGASLPSAQRFPDWTDPGGGPERLIPDLAHDDTLRLSWLPGVGAYRARQIVQQRPFLQVPLTPERLALLPGIGETTAKEVAAWYASLEYGDE